MGPGGGPPAPGGQPGVPGQHLLDEKDTLAPRSSHTRSLTATPGHCGREAIPSTLGHLQADVPKTHHVPLLFFQVTSASLETSTATHAPAREPEPRPGAPAESLPRGPRAGQEQGPARCQQSSLDGAGPDLAGTGRCQHFTISVYWSGSGSSWKPEASPEVGVQTPTPGSPHFSGEPGGWVSLTRV